MLHFWKRPSFWAGLVAVWTYWDPRALHGDWIYDDVASVLNNDVVKGNLNWTEALTRDFWGEPMDQPRSHKSFRPITTLTLRLNWALAAKQGTLETPFQTYYFHFVNVWLHGINTALVTEAAAFVFDQRASMGAVVRLFIGFFLDKANPADVEEAGALLVQFLVGLLFGLHPVHAEAVSNITSRGELLMSFFFLLAFLSYASQITPIAPPPGPVATGKGGKAKAPKDKSTKGKGKHKGKAQEKDDTIPNDNANKEKTQDRGPTSLATTSKKNDESNSGSGLARISYFLCVFVVPCICAGLSLFSKEQGATTICSLVAFDFLRNHTSISQYLKKLFQNDAPSLGFLLRTFVLAVQTLILVGWRIWLNGESSPDFVHEQNPAGFSVDRFTRITSVNWTYCLYIRDMLWPFYLAPDWSGDGIPLIEDMWDYRVWIVNILWAWAIVAIHSLIFGPTPGASKQEKENRRVLLVAALSFLFLPFLLSSNLLVTTGLAKADRVIYLPLSGFCIMVALLFKNLCCYPRNYRWLYYLLFITVLMVFTAKTHERNVAWSDKLTLWTKAHAVNPRSRHTISNAGNYLAKAQRWAEVEEVLRPISDINDSESANDSFLYAVALSNLERCDEAHRIIDQAMEYTENKIKEGETRGDPRMPVFAKSSLMVARAFCMKHDLMEMGRLMMDAVDTDPQNDFAASQCFSYLGRMQNIAQLDQIKNMEPQKYAQMKAGIPAENVGSMEEQMAMYEKIKYSLNPDEFQVWMTRMQGMQQRLRESMSPHQLQQAEAGFGGGVQVQPNGGTPPNNMGMQQGMNYQQSQPGMQQGNNYQGMNPQQYQGMGQGAYSQGTNPQQFQGMQQGAYSQGMNPQQEQQRRIQEMF